MLKRWSFGAVSNALVSVDTFFTLRYVYVIMFFLTLVPFEQSNCIDWINAYYTRSFDQNIVYSGTCFMRSDGKKSEQYRNGRRDVTKSHVIALAGKKLLIFFDNWELFWTLWHCRINTIYVHLGDNSISRFVCTTSRHQKKMYFGCL